MGMGKVIMGLTLIGSAHDAAGGVTDIAITSGIDDSYMAYEFHFYNIHGAEDLQVFTFQVNDYAQPIQTVFSRVHTIDDTTHDNGMGIHTTWDQHIGEAADGNSSQDGDDRFAAIAIYTGADDTTDSLSGVMTLYDPSDTTYSKHFISRVTHNSSQGGDEFMHMNLCGGYIKITSAVTGIKFQFDDGNIDSGVIKMFGVS
jgi:hypothetical protein